MMSETHVSQAASPASPAAAEEKACASPFCLNSFTPTPRRLKYCSHPCALEAINDAKRRPVSLTPAQRRLARELLDELLRSDGLRVVKVPLEDDGRGGKRAKESENPDWFKRFCSLHTRPRYLKRRRRDGSRIPRRKRTPNHYTNIDRRRVVSALTMMVEEGAAPNVYGDILEEFIRAEEKRRRPAEAEDWSWLAGGGG